MFLLDELIYNVYRKFSHWKEEEEKKKATATGFIHFSLFIHVHLFSK